MIERVRNDLPRLDGRGPSALEISHRSHRFERLLGEALAAVRALLQVPDDFTVLLLQGGTSLQFSMVPLNLIPAGGCADYLETSFWSERAIEEASQVGRVMVAGSTKASGYRTLPGTGDVLWSRVASYAHVTSNNTIEGTQWPVLPKAPTPLVVDASSDIMSRPMDFTGLGLVYAGAQKNLGPSGVTLVLLRKDLMARSRADLPPMLRYATHHEHGSLYNTPNTFGIYVLGLTLQWLQEQGGVEAIQRVNHEKAAVLYDVIDGSALYEGAADPSCRSLMNVTFRLKARELESVFLEQAAREGFEGLAGHRSIGGVRASLYNAMPVVSVRVLGDFMRHFERAH